jgi:FKBP-type peptidyl-prolyl cis-trans isomerase 2
MAVEEGNKIKVEYVGTLDDGTEFDNSKKHGQPLEFTVGEGKVIPGFEKSVKGMEVGQEKDFRIGSEDAYGQRNDELMQKIPRDKLPEVEGGIQKGMILMAQTPQGHQIPATVISVDEEQATIDLNHPLAGKDLNFKIKIIEVN